MSPSPVSNTASSAALAAFLRGVERRGAVLAELQSGDAGDGDAALDEAMRRFRVEAAALAMPDWPGRFWALLLAQPRLRYRSEVTLPLAASDRLAELRSGPRAALLLHLAAGLPEEEAATALGVTPAAYRLALQRALPRDAAGQPDAEAWQRLRDEIHRRIKALSPDRLLRLAGRREAALRGEAPATPARAPAGVVAKGRPRWLMPALWSLLALCAIAFAATFWWPGGGFAGLAGRQIRVEPLAAVEEPASRYGAEAATLSNRDFELLADPDGRAQSRELGFYSWLAARDAGLHPVAMVPTEPGEAPLPGEDASRLETTEDYDDAAGS
ncbi:sigma factor-like helix-turn-helix DNA-binding protein [Lysobacter niastensis]|uniref:RNA polymerase sigma factor 70 region 4 type 2 domain-containing protein n=1 Tax=Lysobacter niastensis TaxID=380629 RepID=A0ABS0B3H0_9GAMM|nr:sigma factor-like helix-turn-helix DNA-binding protein [Lysobacter niastensis]MBF6023022.1 hypothetical protein [Lysobacter niastensis]